MEGYCVRCKAKQSISNAEEKITANKRRMVSGTCPKCDCKMNVFLPSKHK